MKMKTIILLAILIGIPAFMVGFAMYSVFNANKTESFVCSKANINKKFETFLAELDQAGINRQWKSDTLENEFRYVHMTYAMTYSAAFCKLEIENGVIVRKDFTKAGFE
jgi:hypothetical protein